MDRAEAMTVLKEILASTDCDSSFVALMPPNSYNLLSKGYQIHIKTRLDTLQNELLESILRRHGLSLRKDKEILIIYRPF